MKIARNRLKAEVPHPVHPEVVFTFQRLDQVDIESLAQLFFRYQSEEKPDVFNVPPEELVVAAARYIFDIKGLEDEDGKPYIYRGARPLEKAEVLRVLSSPDVNFSITYDPPLKVKLNNGKEMTVGRRDVYNWIFVVGNDPETFGISSGKG